MEMLCKSVIGRIACIHRGKGRFPEVLDCKAHPQIHAQCKYGDKNTINHHAIRTGKGVVSRFDSSIHESSLKVTEVMLIRKKAIADIIEK